MRCANIYSQIQWFRLCNHLAVLSLILLWEGKERVFTKYIELYSFWVGEKKTNHRIINYIYHNIVLCVLLWYTIKTLPENHYSQNF